MRENAITRRNGFRPVDSNNIHLTLKFLGDATPASIKAVSDTLSHTCQVQSPFRISIDGVGAFPNWNQPRVIWIGIHAPTALESLFREIDLTTEKLGFPSEGRKFSPHLTLSRVNSSMNDPLFAHVIQSLKAMPPEPKIGEISVTQVNLYKSVLQPGGSVYSVLSSHSFMQ